MRYGVTYTNADGEYTILQSGSKRQATECFSRYSHIEGVAMKYMVRRKGYDPLRMPSPSARDCIRKDLEQRLSRPGTITIHEVVDLSDFAPSTVYAVMQSEMQAMVRKGLAKRVRRGMWEILNLENKKTA